MWHTSTINDLFGLHFQVVHLNKRKWIEARTYAHFTMIGQSLGSVYLAWEALTNFTPQFYFDTSGYAFTYPLARLFGCKVICYTHYPTISSDMVERVKHHSSMYNNNSRIAGRYALHRVISLNSFYWSTNVCNTETWCITVSEKPKSQNMIKSPIMCLLTVHVCPECCLNLP